MKKLTVLFATALLGLVMVAPASAAGNAVWEWDWDYNAAFVDYTNHVGTQSGIFEDPTDLTDLVYPGSPDQDVPQTLYWGQIRDVVDGVVVYRDRAIDEDPSKIVLDPIVAADTDYSRLYTNAGPTAVAHMAHYNNVISGSALKWGRVRSTFQLTPNPPTGFVTDTFVANLDFYFYETPNEVPDGWDEGANGAWSSDDIFLFDQANSDDPFGTFTYGDYDYDYNFLGSYSILDHTRIEQLNYAFGLNLPTGGDEVYLGWITEEGAITPFTSTVVINTVVPEPSTLILLGAGLLGIVGFSYRRRNA